MKKISKTKNAMILAQALFEADTSPSRRQSYLLSLQKLREIITENSDIKEFLKSPLFVEKDYQDFLGLLKTPNRIIPFLMLVIRKRMMSVFEKLVDHYEGLVLHTQGRAKAALSIAHASHLSASTQELISDKLGKVVGQKIDLVVNLDPSLLGGFRLETDTLYLDASLKKSLEDLKNSI